MTDLEFRDFIDNNDLHSFDGLISITLTDDVTHRAVWISFLPELKVSNDGLFGGKPEAEVFYLFDKESYLITTCDQILRIELIQKNYLN